MNSNAFVCLVCLAAPVRAQESAELRVGASVQFELATDAPRYGAPELGQWQESIPGRRWTLRPEDTGPHTIEVRSGVCDSYVIVRDAEGRVVAETGDGPFGEHARLECELERGSTYLIDACSFRDFGPIEITVRAGRTEVPTGEALAREAIADQLATVAARRRAFGDTHIRVAAAYLHLGYLNWRFGQFRNALVAYRRALAILEELPDQQGLVGFTHIQMGAQLSALGEFDEAEAEYRAGLAIAEEIGDDQFRIADGLQGLSAVLKRRGDHAGALPLDRRVLAIMEELGPDHAYHAAISRNNLGLSLRYTGRIREALGFFLSAAATFAEIEGAEPQLATCAQNTGELLLHLGRPRDASASLEEAARIRIRALGWQHPMTLSAVREAAALASRTGRPDVARELAIAAVRQIRAGRTPSDSVLLTDLAGFGEFAADDSEGRWAGSRFADVLRPRLTATDTEAVGYAHAIVLGRRLLLDGDAAGAGEVLGRVRSIARAQGAADLERAAALWYVRALRTAGNADAAAIELADIDGPGSAACPRSFFELERARLSAGEERFAAASRACRLAFEELVERRGERSGERDLAFAFQLRACVDELVCSAGEERVGAAFDGVRSLARAWRAITGPARPSAVETGPAGSLQELSARLPTASALVDVSEHLIDGEPQVFAWVLRSGEVEVRRVDLGARRAVRAAVGDPAAARSAIGAPLRAALGDARVVRVRFGDPLDAVPLAWLFDGEIEARFFDELRPSTSGSSTGAPADGTSLRVAVVGAGKRAAQAAATWRTAGLEVLEARGLESCETADIIHLVVPLAPSPGPLGAEFVMAAITQDLRRFPLDVPAAVRLPLHYEARLELADGTSIAVEELGERDWTACRAVLLDLDGAPRGDGAAATARALRFAGVDAVLLPPDADTTRVAVFAGALAGGGASIDVAARAAGYDLLGGGW